MRNRWLPVGWLLQTGLNSRLSADLRLNEYKVDEELVAATVSITTLFSVATLLGWIYILSGLPAHAN